MIRDSDEVYGIHERNALEKKDEQGKQ